jgi:hypothetical protein
VAFAEAAALRPKIVGESLKSIGSQPDILEAMFEVLEIQRALEGQAEISLIPERSPLLTDLIAAQGGTPPPAPR